MAARPRRADGPARTSETARVCVGQIGGAHGVGGEVRLRSFTSDPEAISGYGPLEAEDGRTLRVQYLRGTHDRLVARFAGIDDRDAAKDLANLRLYVPRERLPEPAAGEFYYTDLIGLVAVDAAGQRLGSVIGVHNFGAGDLIEVQESAGRPTELLPFDDATVPVVDLAAGRIVIARPR